MANNDISSTDGPVTLEPFSDEEVDWIMGNDDSDNDKNTLLDTTP